MTEERIHKATSADGTEIVASVHGQGPPLMLVHGTLGTGELHWGPCVPYLEDRFTCYLMNLRNRPPSGSADDLTPPRNTEDVVAMATSIDGPVALAGLSMGGTLVLTAATRLDNLAWVVPYEPPLGQAMGDDTRTWFGSTIEKMGQEVTAGRLADAARAFYQFAMNEDVPAIDAAGQWESFGEQVPVELAVIQQMVEYGEEHAGQLDTDPDRLAKITAPVSILFGGRTENRWLQHDVVEYALQHVSGARSKEIPDGGHGAPILNPDLVSAEILSFADEVQHQPA